MNELLKRLLDNVKNLWGKWSIAQKAILCGIAAVAVIGIIALFGVSSSPVLVPVIDAPIQSEDARAKIVSRINEEGVRTTLTANGLIQVADEATARRMRTILIREDLIPGGTNPWEVFDRERWTTTDLERNVNLQRAHVQMLTDHIKSIDGIDNASVQVVWPAQRLFKSEQDPVSASIIITPTPGSGITQNRKAIEGMQRLVQLAVEGLSPENIVISDQSGIQLNDFAGLAGFDRLDLIARERRQIQTEQTAIRARVLQQLQSTFSADRVRDVNVTVEMDMSEKTSEFEEFTPFIERSRTPGLPYDDSVVSPSVTRSVSESTTTWRGTGQNPEGPAGTEGQTPVSFRDMSNQYGEMSQTTTTRNEELNRRFTVENSSPKIERVSVSVNIDGTWSRVYDDAGKPVVLPDGTIERAYTPMSADELQGAEALVQGAVGFDAARGDLITVHNIPFDRKSEFVAEDAAFFQKEQVQRTVLIFLAGLGLLLLGFIAVRVVSREMERRKRLAEEERARREQALRESAMAEAEQDGMDVSISVEDRGRMELMESVVNLAKEHPEDCAQLIRTWLSEE